MHTYSIIHYWCDDPLVFFPAINVWENFTFRKFNVIVNLFYIRTLYIYILIDNSLFYHFLLLTKSLVLLHQTQSSISYSAQKSYFQAPTLFPRKDRPFADHFSDEKCSVTFCYLLEFTQSSHWLAICSARVYLISIYAM
jgi:hypothetical protein